ncbi:MAG: hypothetical protein WC346_06435 [Methanogenium sp.]|jgi:hypothetical protein
MEIKRRKVFPKDANSSVVQKDLSMYTRIGIISQVNPEEGTCTVRWLDKNGVRYQVLLTQGSPKEWNIPERGDCVLVAFDHHERARIIRYINVGHLSRSKFSKSLPKLREGEKLWEAGGSYIYMKKNGDIILSTLDQGFFSLEALTGTWKSETVNWKCITEAGIASFGLIRRFKSNNLGERQSVNISDEEGNIYTEYRIRIVEKDDNLLGITGIETPFIDIILGTVVNNNGEIIDKKDNPTLLQQKQLAVKISLQNGVIINVDKEGRISLTAKTWNFNKGTVDSIDPDIEKGLETYNSASGTKGQHLAREHDEITIPISTGYTDEEHLGLTEKSNNNILILQQLARSFISPSGPCEFNPALLTGNISLHGEITEGANNLYVGDD